MSIVQVLNIMVIVNTGYWQHPYCTHKSKETGIWSRMKDALEDILKVCVIIT